MSDPKLLIIVEGGVVQAVHSDIALDLVVCDKDNIFDGDEEPVFPDGTTVEEFEQDAQYGLW
jgi:hypothetical protein